MTLLLQQIVDGIASGALYAALALSLVLVYRASKIVNFAQGEMATLGAFVAWQLHHWGLSTGLAILGAMVVAFVGGALVERTLIRPLSGVASHLTLIIVTVGLMLVINSGQGLLWGFDVREFPRLSDGPVIAFGPAVMSRQALAIVLAVVAVAAALYLLLQRSRPGLAIRAASTDSASARLVGVPVGLVLSVSWGAAAAIGTLMASLAAPQLLLQPGMLTPTLIYSFAAAILGGLDSPLGAVVGGLVVGLTENLAGTYLPGVGSDFKQAVALALIMVVLLFKAEGLFGTKVVVRV